MPEWIVSHSPVDYLDAVDTMEARVAQIITGSAPEAVWLLEHPPLYTAGSLAKPDDLLTPDRFPVHQTRRGGQYTYHGPGQRVAYVMLDLNKRGRDVRKLVETIEAWIIRALAEFNIDGHITPGRVGIWVNRPDKPPLPDGSPHEDKIAAVGIKLRKWVSFHGVSINIDPDLTHFDGIVPCGIKGHGVTSLVDLGHTVTMADVDAALRTSFDKTFGA